MLLGRGLPPFAIGNGSAAIVSKEQQYIHVARIHSVNSLGSCSAILSEMYIGPWQEYKLSQASRAPHGLNVSGPDIKDDLRNTLLKKLSPEDVAKVMSAMNPLLETSNEVADSASGEQVELPPLPSARRREKFARVRHYRRAPQKAPPTLHEQFKLPDINSPKYRLDSSSPSQNGTPQSVRSSKSEPLHSTRLPYSRKSDIRAFSPPVDTSKRKSYDASNLVATLRLERRTRPTLKETAGKSDFGQFWGWKGKEGDDGACQSTVDSKKKQAEIEVEKKIQQVKNMHALYKTGHIEEVTPPVGAPTIDITASPVGKYEKPQTPVVEDRDLTSTDLAVVSKYFKKKSTGSLEIRESPKHNRPVLNPLPITIEGEQVQEEEEVEASIEEINRNETASVEEAEIDEAPSRIICSPVQVLDTSSYGSPDGLLRWTTMLNPDELDALY